MTPEELVARTAGPINALGAVFYFHPDTIAVGRELGLDGFRWYVLGRGGLLGDVHPSVVQSAFGYFHGDVIEKIWNSAREIVAPRDGGVRHLQCNADIGRAALADVDGLAGFCDAAEAALVGVDPSALALYAAIAAEPLPEDLPGRAMQLAVVHRELRGSQHLAAVAAAGMHASVAHAIRRPADVETFGWSDVVIPDGATEELAAIDETTDRLSASVYATLSESERTSFVEGTAAMSAALGI